MSTNRYRLTLKTPEGTAVAFYDAPSLDEALARAALEHEHFTLIEARISGPELSPTLQRDGLIKAMRPLLSVLLAMLNNPTLAVLFTAERRAQLEGFCRDAQEAMLNAGVTK